ncbi:Acyltransferase OS=Lysinibacillus sphaericus OX=1421 GN=LS41612_00935 PE=4 SV=1 [Lysinibacillus sphaericus]
MEKKRFKFVIPVMVIVAIGSVYMLTNYYAEVPDLNQLLITICATLISGVLAYFLFPQQGENKVDDQGPINYSGDI